LSRGVVTLLRWDRKEANVRRLITCETPVLSTFWSLSFPQFPVERAVLSPLEIASALM
jgi:hypothetical protein